MKMMMMKKKKKERKLQQRRRQRQQQPGDGWVEEAPRGHFEDEEEERDTHTLAFPDVGQTQFDDKMSFVLATTPLSSLPTLSPARRSTSHPLVLFLLLLLLLLP